MKSITRWIPICLIAIATATTTSPMAAAQEGAAPDAPRLDAALPPGAHVEARLETDFDHDGQADIAYVARIDDARWLGVLLSTWESGQAAEQVHMGTDPLVDATLGEKKGVLIVEDLTGGTTAVSSTYRYRYDSARRRMRLIGDDAKLYSRTNQHDWHSVSTNRLTGLRLQQVGKLDAAGDYIEQPVTRGKVATTPIYLKDSPDPAATLGWGEGH